MDRIKFSYENKKKKKSSIKRILFPLGYYFFLYRSPSNFPFVKIFITRYYQQLSIIARLNFPPVLYRVGKAERSLPKNSSYLRCVTVCNRGTISGITILYEARPWRTLARNWRKLNENETPGSPGLNIPRLIEVEGRAGSKFGRVTVFPFSPALDQQLLSMQSAIYIWLAATVAAIGVIKRYGTWLARFKSLSPRRCSLNGTCHHVKIQFVPSSWKWKLRGDEEEEGEATNERQRSRGVMERYTRPSCYELNVQEGGRGTRSKF